MAGTKESPRQKMIGMMYLVLTALLALQVSSAVILKFQTLNNTLENAVDQSSKENTQKLAAINDQIAKRGNKEKEIKIAREATVVYTASRDLIKYIENIKNELIERSGGTDEEGNLKGAKEETEVEVMMIGSDKGGKAYELEKRLNEFVKIVNSRSEIQFPKIALSGNEDPFFQNNAEQKIKDFAELNFAQTPVAAALAVLSEFQSRALSMETSAISQVWAKIGLKDFPIDKIIPKVSTLTKYVPAGTRYEADLFVAATSAKVQPEMEVNGKAIDVGSNGVGKITFMAEGGSFSSDGTLKKSWSGKIKMRRADGTDTVMTVTEEYYVVKPAMQISSASVLALYRNCRNTLNIQVPALGASYNPSFSASNADIIKSTQTGVVSIIPKSHQTKLKVMNNGLFIGEQEYKVKSVPRPEIKIIIGNKQNPVKTGIDKSDIRTIIIKAVADKDFEEMLPDDAKFKVTEWSLTLKKGRSARGFEKYEKEIENIAKFNNAQEGDFLLIEILKVKRRNYKGEWEEVEIPNSVFSVPVI